MIKLGHDTLKTKRTLNVQGKSYNYFSIAALQELGYGQLSKLPFSLKVLLENLLRYEDGESVTVDDIKAVAMWLKDKKSTREVNFLPARVLMQDFTGVPAIVDLAAMRNAMQNLGGDIEKINPLAPVDLIVDHSVQVDEFGTATAFEFNVEKEMQRNEQRYQFLRWGQKAFQNFRVVPPGTGICHQVNLEYLAKGIWSSEIKGENYAYPDTLVGTDSHTTMINSLGVLGWGVGGIEAEAAMLGQPISMVLPEVIGFRLDGKLREGITATDLVLTITQMLRTKGVVGKFVEFYGPGLRQLPLPDRATIANMAPEYGATCGFFPIDQETINYMQLTGRDEHNIALVITYAKAQGLWHDENSPEAYFTDTLSLDLNKIESSLAGPKRPQDRVSLSKIADAFKTEALGQADINTEVKTDENYSVKQGDVVIAAITSCTNTSNPSVLIAAGLLAKKALEKGLKRKPWVKTSLAPGSKVVTTYLENSGLQKYLNDLDFELVGYGCTTCIGNSGPLPDPVSNAIKEGNLVVSAVLSGNRNFEGRIHPQVKANWLASPPLVVAFALAGTTNIDLTTQPLGHDKENNPVFLKDIWPSTAEISAEVEKITGTMFREQYADVFTGPKEWRELEVTPSETYHWDKDSTYIQLPPFFENLPREPGKISNIINARILALLGDSITTDHISPAGSIPKDSPAGKYLISLGVQPKDFNSYGARRGNHEVMMRGTLANIRIKNEMVPGQEGGITKYIPTGEVMSIYDAAMKYQQQKIPLIIVAGKEYGSGSSRDWAAKGVNLLGVKAVIAESFERIHRSNLIGMGVLPLEFKNGDNRKTLKLDGTETFDITGLVGKITPRMDVPVAISRKDGSGQNITVTCRIDTQNEVEYYRHGGILQYVLRHLSKR